MLVLVIAQAVGMLSWHCFVIMLLSCAAVVLCCHFLVVALLS
jgi:hypothetical protein